MLAPARTPPDRHVIVDRLFRFYDRCAASGQPAVGQRGSAGPTLPGFSRRSGKCRFGGVGICRLVGGFRPLDASADR
ncbi:hypothetical protein GCM10011574_49130 [Microbispora bryophytorum]|uniref:Uncharacterized protein n=1 Tax=Microbispora bryophytorum TaxID=1460882 RepID=A0A8H9H5Y1_9ACTN|nr:hypothetical protein GCM10011574_49130 [Microbispora bryophytorum]